MEKKAGDTEKEREKKIIRKPPQGPNKVGLPRLDRFQEFSIRIELPREAKTQECR